MIEPSDHKIIEAAREHGLKAEFNQASGAWYAVDKYGQPDFVYGMFVSEAACARAYCEYHGILPKAPDIMTPDASMRITEAAPQGLISLFRFEIITITTLVVALTATIVFVAKYIF